MKIWIIAAAMIAALVPVFFILGPKLDDSQAFVRAMRSENESGQERVVRDFASRIPYSRMLQVVDEAFPICHAQSHPIGRAIYSATENLGEALKICGDYCNYGCAHGTIMGLFGADGKKGHDLAHEITNLDALFSNFDAVAAKLCGSSEVAQNVSKITCIHALGHAAMYASQNNLARSAQMCLSAKDPREKRTCATGVFMEYTRNPEFYPLLRQKDFFPCDMYPELAGACFREKARHMFEAWGGDSAFDACRSLPESLSLKCFSGLGYARANAGYKNLQKPETFDRVCPVQDPLERQACLDGAVNFVTTTFDTRAYAACRELAPELFAMCRQQIDEPRVE